MRCLAVAALAALSPFALMAAAWAGEIGDERAIPDHLPPHEIVQRDLAAGVTSLESLLEFGRTLFSAVWTQADGGGRPLTKGDGTPLTDPNDPLVFPRNFNRVSGPDSNSCAGCHNQPFGIPGGGGGIVTNVFVLGQRFDFATFDPADPVAKRGTIDEDGRSTTLQTIGNSRATLGMFGSGYVELLAREITADLQAIRDSLLPGRSAALVSKGIDFGTLRRPRGGNWNTSRVRGLPPPSLVTTGPSDPPTLIIRPFHQSGAVVSLREFTTNAFNHHHGMQAVERFGAGDFDGDGVERELTTGDITAITLYQAGLSVPGRLIPDDRAVEDAILLGEYLFHEKFEDGVALGCNGCHIPQLLLRRAVFDEPGRYNPHANLNASDVRPIALSLDDSRLPPPRLTPAEDGSVLVPVFTDFRLHRLTPFSPGDGNGADDSLAGSRREATAYMHSLLMHSLSASGSKELFERELTGYMAVWGVDRAAANEAISNVGAWRVEAEPLNQMARPGTSEFSDGNSLFLTKKLWGTANEKPFFSHGKFTTFREAIDNHFGEADGSRRRFSADLAACEQAALIEYLKTLQVLDPRALVEANGDAASLTLIVNEAYEAKPWPPEDAEVRANDARNVCWSLIALVPALPAAAAEAPKVMWEKTFGGAEDDGVVALTALPDGGLAAAGWTASKGAGSADAWVLRLDAAGNLVWDRTFGGADWDGATALAALPDGGLAVAGRTDSKGAGDRDAWVLRLDAAGSVVWERTFGGVRGDKANALAVLPDGGLAVAGVTASKGAGGADAWVLRLDAGGSLLWEHTFGGALGDMATALAVLPDGGFAVAGWTESKGAGDLVVWVLRLDAAGNLVWDRTFGAAVEDTAAALIVLADGGLAVAGITESKGAGGLDVWVLRLDAAGNLLWDRTFGGADWDAAQALTALPDGGFALAGWTRSKGAGAGDAWVLGLDATGNLVWERTFGGSGHDEALSVTALPDGGLAVAGWTTAKGAGGADAWVIRLESDSRPQ